MIHLVHRLLLFLQNCVQNYSLLNTCTIIKCDIQNLSVLAKEAESNMEAVQPPLFLRFINLLMNDAVFLLDEALSNMAQLRQMLQARYLKEHTRARVIFASSCISFSEFIEHFIITHFILLSFNIDCSQGKAENGITYH